MATKTHMRSEVEEIPAAVERLLGTSGHLLANVGRDLAKRNPSCLITVARGSSDHAAAYLKYAIELTARIPVASIGPSIASIYGATLKLEGAAAIAISQSGKSPDIVAMAESARRGGAMTIAITNTSGSPLAAVSDHPIDILAGPEKSVAATKTFVSSVVAGLAILASWSGDKALGEAVRNLPQHLADAVASDWSALAAAIGDHDSLFVLGRGPSAAMAEEAALKLKETCSIHAEAYSSAEVMHGPLALVGPSFPVLSLIARDAAEASSLAIADTLADKGAKVLVTAGRGGKVTVLPHAATGHPLTDPLTLIAAFYGFVEAFARSRGIDPDVPRNLRKVTETI